MKQQRLPPTYTAAKYMSDPGTREENERNLSGYLRQIGCFCEFEYEVWPCTTPNMVQLIDLHEEDCPLVRHQPGSRLTFN